jgi:hypothetical protein
MIGDLPTIEASETRPSSFRNADDKTNSRAVAGAVASYIAASAPDSQRAFVPGRNFLLNIMEANALSRCVASSYPALGAATACFGFGAAFLSIALRYLSGHGYSSSTSLAVLRKTARCPACCLIAKDPFFAVLGWAFATSRNHQ